MQFDEWEGGGVMEVKGAVECRWGTKGCLVCMESCCAVRVAAVKHVLHMKDKSAREECVDTEVCLVTVLAAPRWVEFGS